MRSKLPEQAESESMERLFTVEEANQLIPRLRWLIHRVISCREKLEDLEGEIQPARAKVDENGGSFHGAAYLHQLTRLSEAAQEIETMGVLIKDLTTGLCDFPHLRDGRVVYLCWRLGEEEISWWHEVETGFAGRRPL